MRVRDPLRATLVAVLLFVGACGSAGDDASPAELVEGELSTSEDSKLLSFTLVAPARPVTTTDEEEHLLFEFLIQNPGSESVSIDRIDVFAPGERAPLASYHGDALLEILTVLGPEPGTTAIESGGVALAFFDVARSRRERTPGKLIPRVWMRRGDRTVSVRAPDVAIVQEEPVRVGAPLRGGNLVDMNGCCDGAHRRALFSIEDGLYVAQRYAIDFLRAEGESSFSGDPSRNESFFIYGADVLAVASGHIVAVRDGVPDNIPTEPLPPADLETAAGNYVVQALGDGQFALYAHLLPGSVGVAPGDRVRRGQVLGRVGNTGNSTEPHLHFHVMDGPSPLASNGLPYVFDRFQLQARIDVTGPEPALVSVQPPRNFRYRLPMSLDVIAFP